MAMFLQGQRKQQ